MTRPTVVSLFAGGGGSSMGYKIAGFDVRLAAEWDDHAAACYRLNFPGTALHHGDVAALSDGEALRLARVAPGELDVLDGSPPCQGFSTAGKRRLSDGRNQLFLEYVRLLAALRPRHFVMENVPGLLSGKMAVVLRDVFAELRGAGPGYRVRAAVLCAADYGVPQLRRRVIFLGTRGDLEHEPAFPAPTVGRHVTAGEALGVRAGWVLAGADAGQAIDFAQPAPTVLKAALGGVWAGCVGVADAPNSLAYVGGRHRGSVEPFADAPAKTVLKKGYSDTLMEYVAVGDVPNSLAYVGGRHQGSVEPFADAPAKTIAKEGYSDSGMEQVAVGDLLPRARSAGGPADPSESLRALPAPEDVRSVFPAPRLKGKALELAKRLAEGERASQERDGGFAQHVHRVDRRRPAATVTKEGGGHVAPTELRGLSVGEVMRLQSFPDDYRWPPGTTWRKGWARVGNSVPPLMMAAVALEVRAAIDRNSRSAPLAAAEAAGQFQKRDTPEG